MCIYLKECNNTEKSEEHIFPACIGGIRKLNNLEVSAEANKIFKPLEDIFAHKSEIKLTRDFYGPGKRGKNKRNDAHVTIIYDEYRNVSQLGYIFMGKVQLIPQILINESSEQIIFAMGKEDEKNTKEIYRKFFEEIVVFDIFNQKFVYEQIEYTNSKPDIIIGINNKKVIIASHSTREKFDLSKIDEMIQKIKKTENIWKSEFSSEIVEKPKVIEKMETNSISNRVFAKTAFNCLCFLKGAEFVKNESFDNFRKWIITGEGHSENWLNEDIVECSKLKVQMPEMSHWCMFTVINQKVCAVVCFYNIWARKFEIGTLPKGETLSTLGYICDFKNHKEYTLYEYINYIYKVT